MLQSGKSSLAELASLFLKLGTIGFGGPAAHIAMMEDEVVRRRRWMSREDFLDLLGMTNLIPGPNSTEMAIHIGFVRAGWKGLLLAGACFIIPAAVITLIFAHLYVAYGSLPQVGPFLAGIRPAIIAVIIAAVFRLSRPLVKKPFEMLTGLGVVGLNLLGVDEILLLAGAGAAGLLWKNHARLLKGALKLMSLVPAFIVPVFGGAEAGGAGPSLPSLGLFFLKVGALLYGSGYVLVAFLQSGLVDARHWLTQAQLFDAVAVGQFTPGPVLSTATFIGYLLLGIPGAAAATTAIFLPSFVYVSISNPLIPKIRRSPLARGFLDGVNAASLGLMLAVTFKLALAALSGVGSWLVLLLASILVMVWNVNAAWIVLGAAIVGWVSSLLGVW